MLDIWKEFLDEKAAYLRKIFDAIKKHGSYRKLSE